MSSADPGVPTDCWIPSRSHARRLKYVSLLCMPPGLQLNDGTQNGSGNKRSWNIIGGVCPLGELASFCPSLAVGGEGGQSGQSAGGDGSKWEQLSLFGQLLEDVLNLVRAARGERDIFDALKAYRELRGASAAVRLDVGGNTYVGDNLARSNPIIQGTWEDFVQHAEGDAFSQALKSGIDYQGQSATLYVSRLEGIGPCRLICRPSIPAVARQMGLSEVTVFTPEGWWGTWDPTIGKWVLAGQ